MIAAVSRGASTKLRLIERTFWSLKENLLWVRTFHTIEEHGLALLRSKQAQNESWLIEPHGHRSPAEFRRDQMDNQALLA